MIYFHGIANLTADPETVKVNDTTTKINFSVAANDPFQKDKEKAASFFNCEMWGKGAEAFAKFHGKGDRVCLMGRLVQERWQDKESGANRSMIKLKVQDFEFVKKGDAVANSAPPVADSDVPF